MILNDRNAKRTSDTIRYEILKVLKDGKIYSYFTLRTKIKTSSQSIKTHCEMLEKLDFIKIDFIPKEKSGSGKSSYKVRITEEGLKWLDKLGSIRRKL